MYAPNTPKSWLFSKAFRPNSSTPLQRTSPSRISALCDSQVAIWDGKLLESTSRASADPKNVDLRVADLEQLADLLLPGSLAASTLEDLCITGVLFVTKSLERALRQKTVPGNCRDPMGVRRNALGNSVGAKRVTISSEEVRRLEGELEGMKGEAEELENEQNEGRYLEALKALLEKVKSTCGLGGLRKLKLDVVVFRDPGRMRLKPAEGAMWPEVWNVAGRTFDIVTKAVSQSGIAVQEMDVFGERDSCAVQVFDLSNLTDEPGALAGLKTLSLSTSNRVRLDGRPSAMDSDPDDWDIRRRGGLIRGPPPAGNDDGDSSENFYNDEKNFLGIADWLKQLPELESLDLHSTHVPQAGLNRSHPGHEPSILRHIASLASLPKLKSLTLRGWSVDGDILLSLLKNSPNLQCLSLDQVALTSPTSAWVSILRYLSHPTMTISHLYLNNCFADSLRTYMRFWSGCPSHTEPTGGKDVDVDRPASGGRISVQQSQWRVERARAFGPMKVWN